MNRAKRAEQTREAVMRWHASAAGKSTAHAAARDGESRTAAVLWHGAVAQACRACGAFEWVALGYLAVSSAFVLIFAQNAVCPVAILAVQSLVAAMVLALCLLESRSAKIACPAAVRKLWHFSRHWYPHLFFLFCFEELGHLVHLVVPGWRDATLVTFDYWLTGVHPAIWLEQFATPARNEFMQSAYLTYFAYLLVLGGVLYYRRDWRGYWSVMTYSAVAYAIGYLIAILFPIESPWFSMAGRWHASLQGGPVTALLDFIEHYGRVRGAAFPSEHVAGSVAALWGAWRHRRWLFWAMLPLVLCMCVSTVWGRYHYVADIFGGITTGTLGYVLGGWLVRRPGAWGEPHRGGARLAFEFGPAPPDGKPSLEAALSGRTPELGIR